MTLASRGTNFQLEGNRCAERSHPEATNSTQFVEPLDSGRRVHRRPTPFGASAHSTPPAGIGNGNRFEFRALIWQG